MIGRRAVFAAVFLAVSSLTVSAAGAETSDSNTATVETTPTEVRSITVSPNVGTFATCWDPVAQQLIATLTIPDGHCLFGTPTQQEFVSVTNGATPGHININGNPAQASDGGKPWALGATPGADVFTETSHNTVDGVDDLSLSTTPACDQTFSPDMPGLCAATANETNDEFLRIDAPSVSTDSSATFTIVTTWTAVP
jgi:hypothetical protein